MSGSSDSRQQVWDVFAKAIETFDKKNADYGDAWRTNGWRGNLSRVFEKTQRVRHLTWRPDPRVPAVGDEQVLDTLQDMLNSIAFAIINLIEEVEYGHETPRSERARQYEHDYEPGATTEFFERVGSEIRHHTQLPGPGITRTVINAQDVLDGQLNPPMDPLPTGPDEQGAAEQKNQTPRQKRVVRDTPQA